MSLAPAAISAPARRRKHRLTAIRSWLPSTASSSIPTLYASVPFDPHKDFDPVTLAVTFGTSLSVNPSVPATTVAELVTSSARNPGKYNYTSGGVGTPSHLLGELFRMSLSLDLPHIPFTGSGPAIAAVVAGHVPIAFTALTPSVAANYQRQAARAGGHEQT